MKMIFNSLFKGNKSTELEVLPDSKGILLEGKEAREVILVGFLVKTCY